MGINAVQIMKRPAEKPARDKDGGKKSVANRLRTEIGMHQRAIAVENENKFENDAAVRTTPLADDAVRGPGVKDVLAVEILAIVQVKILCAVHDIIQSAGFSRS